MAKAKTEFDPSIVRKKLRAGSVTYKDCIYTARWGFYFTGGRSAEKYADRIRKLYRGAVIVETADIWKPFHPSATLARSSHFLVRFSLPGPTAKAKQ